jgi:TRAP-type C4-dicarboxylate transport system permease small subunit
MAHDNDISICMLQSWQFKAIYNRARRPRRHRFVYNAIMDPGQRAVDTAARVLLILFIHIAIVSFYLIRESLRQHSQATDLERGKPDRG